MPKTIALDADGVILHFRETFVAAAEEILQRKISPDPAAYRLDRLLRSTAAEADLAWRYFSEKKFWRDIVPLPGAMESIRALESSGYEIHVVTAIPDEHRDDRLFNFRQHGFTPRSIHCVSHDPVAKMDPIKRLDPIMFVDDRKEHLNHNQQVPLLVWIDLGDDEQRIDPAARHDIKVDSLLEWTDAFLSNEAHWLNHNKNLHQARQERLEVRSSQVHRQTARCAF